MLGSNLGRDIEIPRGFLQSLRESPVTTQQPLHRFFPVRQSSHHVTLQSLDNGSVVK
jgi:hypothetical protein